jgi:hypothetical protein
MYTKTVAQNGFFFLLKPLRKTVLLMYIKTVAQNGLLMYIKTVAQNGFY